MSIQKCIGPFFPTTLCEVLVFGSVCRPRPPPPPLPPLCHNTIFHTQLCHTLICHTQSFTQQSFTQQFFTQPLSHTQSLTHNFVTQQFFTHNFVTHTHTLFGTWRHPRAFCVVGMALLALGWIYAVALCVAGVALGDIHAAFAWPAWHLWRWAGSGG